MEINFQPKRNKKGNWNISVTFFVLDPRSIRII